MFDLFSNLARQLWIASVNLRARTGRTGGDEPRVWYGGARSGKTGGPTLKLRRLKTIFPEHSKGFNLVYALSFAPYLSRASLEQLRESKIPVVLNQNGVFYPAWFPKGWEERNRPMAELHALASHVLYQSEFCRKASHRFLGERTGGSEILYNAVDTDLFVPGQAGDAKSFAVLITGRVGGHQAYRLTQAIEGLAVARAQGLDARLVAAGVMDDDVMSQARQTIDRLGLDSAVSLQGPFDSVSAPGIYRQAQAYLTLTHQDACPSAVIEAMASGLPVVHAESGGVPELVGPAGIGIKTGEDWERALIPSAQEVGQAILTAAQERERLSLIARERAVRLFDIKSWVARHRTLFQDLLARHG
ncbi:MAG: glycosyltransferase [Rhodospirillales bacterium]|nr:MAG: glycosyltransferase [Rhodospirillales bacterium]